MQYFPPQSGSFCPARWPFSVGGKCVCRPAKSNKGLFSGIGLSEVGLDAALGAQSD